MEFAEQPFDLVFVVGAPRTGTSLLHALICTSAKSNQYVGECSYFTALVWSYVTGLEHFDIHARYYFGDHSQFFEYHGALLRRVVADHWRQLGQPALLSLKDPNLTRAVPMLAYWFPTARFVAIHRDPRDVVASRVQVQRRKHPTFDFLTRENILSLAQEYHAYYETLEAAVGGFADRFCYVEYEGLVRGEYGGLSSFLELDDIDPAKVWQRSKVTEADYRGNEWNSQLYHKPVTDDSVGSFRDILDPASAALVIAQCADIMSKIAQRAAFAAAS